MTPGTVQKGQQFVQVFGQTAHSTGSHPLSAALAELRRISTFGRVTLRGLTADEVQRMLSSITGQEITWGLSKAVHRQTEGNPLFVQEVVRYMSEEGLITREGEQWRREYNEIRPHSALGYRPPSPEAKLSLTLT